MLFYLHKCVDCRVDIETVEAVILERFKQYSLPSVLQYDTEEFNYYDRISHLFLCIIATDYPYFRDVFVGGELKLFQQRLKVVTCSALKKELFDTSQYLNSLLQSEDVKKLKSVSANQIRLVQNVILAVLRKIRHSLRKSHPKTCRKYKLTLPFTFPLRLVAKREVEVTNGKVSLSCGRWNELLDLIFEFLLKLELSLIANCDDLKKRIYDAEDDRLRQIITRCLSVLSGDLSRGKGIVRADRVDHESLYFPPCMAGLHQILRHSHRLSYTSRFQYSLFLKDIGLTVDENISFWENEYRKPQKGSCCTHGWQENQRRYRYQIQHMYGLIGAQSNKTSHPCGTFIGELQPKMDGGCPFQHLSAEQLRRALPKSVRALPDVEDILASKSEGLPQRACAQYLSCLQRVLQGRGEAFPEGEGRNRLFVVMSPLQFYCMAKSC